VRVVNLLIDFCYLRTLPLGLQLFADDFECFVVWTDYLGLWKLHTQLERVVTDVAFLEYVKRARRQTVASALVADGAPKRETSDSVTKKEPEPLPLDEDL